MIHRRTVFILGSGASAPFGFPLGRSLLLRVVDWIQRREANLYQVLAGCGFSDGHMQDFARELEMSMQPSVDAFLENRPEFLEVGKASIAAALIPYEAESNLLRSRSEPHWYEYLFSRLGPTRADYEQGELSVITFNYDRSFEHFLFLSLRASFGLLGDECKSLLQVVPVVHVYGQLGALDYISPDGRRYYPDLTPQIVKKYSKEIRIVHEGLPDDPQFKQAHDWLSKAEVVCFLGFGYHKSNVERLRLDLVQQGAPVYGSVYGMMSSEVDGIRPMFAKHRDRLMFGTNSQDVLLFLRNSPVFL